MLIIIIIIKLYFEDHQQSSLFGHVTFYGLSYNMLLTQIENSKL
jgi:hypothetical protein